MSTPQLDKIHSVKNESQIIGEFLEYLLAIRYICKYDNRTEQFYNTHEGIQKLLADYFGIDLDEAERERERLLKEIRDIHNGQ